MADGFNGDLYGMLRPIHRGILELTGFSVLALYVLFMVRLVGHQKIWRWNLADGKHDYLKLTARKA